MINSNLEKYNKIIEKEMGIKLNYWTIIEKFLEYSKKLEKINKKIEKLYEKENFKLIQKEIKERNKIEQFVSIYKTIKELVEEINLFKEMLEKWEISIEEYKKEIQINWEKIKKQLNKLKELKLNLWYSWDCYLIIEWWEWWEESCLFVKDLFESYKKYFEKVWIKYEINYILESDFWWYKNLKVRLYWVDDAYKLMYFENWIHQVMRVPKTEKRWRIHTSVVKVKVLPIIENVNIEIDPKNIIEEWASRAWGKWGQNVNKRETAYHIIYKIWEDEKWNPIKLVIDAREERYQWRNKEIAYQRLKEKLFQIEQEKRLSKYKELTKSSWNRSDKIRTYQFQNNLISDTRCSKKFSLEKIFENWLYEEIHNEIIKENF